MAGAEAIVVGAGVVGAACAWRLAQLGLRVLILERDAPASGATQAALGVLTFHARPDLPPLMNELCWRSRTCYTQFADDLAEINGSRVRLERGGQLLLAFTEEDVGALDRTERLNRELGIQVERVAPEECRLLEPAANVEAWTALFFPWDAWLDNTELTLAIIQAAERSGAAVLRGTVTALAWDGGRVRGVVCDGRVVEGDWIVLAAGCWAGLIAGVPRLPLSPFRGQALSVAGRMVRRVVTSPRGYLVPRGEGQTLVGATVESVGFDVTNTLGGLHQVAAMGIEIVPALARQEFLGAWAGLRPGTPDQLPLLGPFRDHPNLIAATGHFRRGVLLAPITADIVCTLVASRPAPAYLEQLAPDRMPGPASSAPVS